MTRSLAIALLLLALAAPARALEDQNYSAAVVAAARGEIIPRYQGFWKATKALRSSLDKFCKAPSERGLGHVRTRFLGAVVAWEGIQFITFGPVSEHQRASRIEYWPEKRNVVGRQLADVLSKQDHAALEPNRFASTSVGVQGLPALERLLFDDDALAKLAPGVDGAAYRCRLLQAISANLEAIAEDIATGWTEGEESYLRRIEHPSDADEDVPSGRDAAGRLLNDLLTATIATRDLKLLVPLGEDATKAKPQAVEFWRSKYSTAALIANLVGLRELFETHGSFGTLLSTQPQGESLAWDVAATIERATTLVRRLESTLDEAVSDLDERKKIEEIAGLLADLRDLLAGPVATNLNLPIGFNALDGD